MARVRVRRYYVKCPKCEEEGREAWIYENEFENHLRETHGIESEDEITALFEKAQETRVRREFKGTIIEEFGGEEREEEEEEFGGVEQSSEILRGIMKRLDFSAKTIAGVCGEVEDLERSLNPEAGQFVSPADIQNILITFGVKQPKLSYVIQKYVQRVQAILNELSYRYGHPPPTFPSPSLQLQTPSYTSFPAIQFTPSLPNYPAVVPPSLHSPPPLYYPPPSPPRERERRVKYELDDGTIISATVDEIRLFESLRTQREELQMRREEHDMKMKKLEAEIKQMLEDRKESEKGEDERLKKLEDEMQKMREELHRKDLEIMQKDFERKLDQLRRPSFFEELAMFQSVAEHLGYKKGGITGTDILYEFVRSGGEKVDQLLDIARARLPREIRRRGEAERRKLAEEIEKRIEKTEEEEQFLSSLRKMREVSEQ